MLSPTLKGRFDPAISIEIWYVFLDEESPVSLYRSLIREIKGFVLEYIFIDNSKIRR